MGSGSDAAFVPEQDLLVVRHMVWLERAEREERERVVREAREQKEREAAEKEAEKEVRPRKKGITLTLSRRRTH